MTIVRAFAGVILVASLGGLAIAAPAGTGRDSGDGAATVRALVEAATAGNQARVEKIAAQLKIQPKPVGVNRRLARDLNERGLVLWQRQRFAEAATYFAQAHGADASDAEIAENLGYALLKSGKIREAEPAILEALALGPERASAWGSLGSIYAKQGKHSEAVACVLTAYRFAPNPKRARDLYSRLAVSEEDPRVRAMMAEVVTRLPQ